VYFPSLVQLGSFDLARRGVGECLRADPVEDGGVALVVDSAGFGVGEFE
jgi:hypothetical protein